jgi:hypothetical protein
VSSYLLLASLLCFYLNFIIVRMQTHHFSIGKRCIFSVSSLFKLLWHCQRICSLVFKCGLCLALWLINDHYGGGFGIDLSQVELKPDIFS